MGRNSDLKRPWENGDPVSVDIATVPCSRCRSRKVKCGGEYPACLACVKADVPCIIADPTAPRQYTRTELSELQKKVIDLESQLNKSTSTRTTGAQRNLPVIGHGPPQSSNMPSSSDSGTNRYVGQENSVSFFLSKLLLNRRDCSSAATFSRSTGAQGPKSVYHAPHSFPARETALSSVGEYFRDHYVIQPFLDPTKIYETLDKQPCSYASLTESERHDLFQLNMVLAIGSIRLFRDGVCDLHPFGFFTAALEVHPPSMSSFNTLHDVENLMLIARFGVFYDIGCSLWEIGRLSMRICVEIGLHRLRPRHFGGLQDLQRCRVMFWESYLLDRSSSFTLGRPFAISDASITAALPDSSNPRNTVFNWRVGLCRLTSRIRYALQSHQSPEQGRAGMHPVNFPKASAAFDDGETLSLLRQYNGRLRDWHHNAPRFDHPACMEETPDFFDLTYQEAKLRLFRAAIDQTYASTRHLPINLLRPCLRAACAIIHSFNALRRGHLVTCTRAYTHLVFVAGLVVAFMAQKEQGKQSPQRSTSKVDMDDWLDGPDSEASIITPETMRHALSTAGELLTWFSETMPDVHIYARIFNNLKQELDRGKPPDRAPPANPSDAPVQRSTSSSFAHHLDGLGPESLQPEAPQPQHFLPVGSTSAYGGDVLGSINSDTATFGPGIDWHSYLESLHANEFQEDWGSLFWPFTDVLEAEGLDTNLFGHLWDGSMP